MSSSRTTVALVLAVELSFASVAFADPIASATSVPSAADSEAAPAVPLPSASAASAAPSTAPSAPPKRPTRPSAPAVTEPPASAELRADATPRRALEAFLDAGDAGDFEAAARFLDLRGMPHGKESDGPELAGMLYRILRWRLDLDASSLPDEPNPDGVPESGVVIDVIRLGGKSYAIALAPIRAGSSADVRWAFSKSTVAAIPILYGADERRKLEARVPPWLRRQPVAGLYAWQWIGLTLLVLGVYLLARGLGVIARFVVSRALQRGLSPSSSSPAFSAVSALGRPSRLAVATLAFYLLAPYLAMSRVYADASSRACTILFIFALAWAVVALVRVFTATWESTLPDDAVGDLESRGLRTRLTMIRRILTVLVGFVAAGAILLQFEVVRTVGLSLLASAGILGVVVGFAAQRTIAGIIAGIEMSITQPLRIGDIVVFRPGEIGTVEHIFFTYVVLRLFDDRRLIVPVTRVMAESFENWTRTDAAMQARVEIFVDYAAPIDRVRGLFLDLCRANERWDGRIARVDVFDATDKALHLRGVASVDNAAKAYDLGCELREAWLGSLRELEEGRFLPAGRIVSVPSEEPPTDDSKAAEGPTKTSPSTDEPPGESASGDEPRRRLS
ncbi:MAG: mechanosensitive ion channel [Polyangiaceae bacterium]